MSIIIPNKTVTAMFTSLYNASIYIGEQQRFEWPHIKSTSAPIELILNAVLKGEGGRDAIPCMLRLAATAPYAATPPYRSLSLMHITAASLMAINHSMCCLLALLYAKLSSLSQVHARIRSLINLPWPPPPLCNNLQCTHVQLHYSTMYSCMIAML